MVRRALSLSLRPAPEVPIASSWPAQWPRSPEGRQQRAAEAERLLLARVSRDVDVKDVVIDSCSTLGAQTIATLDVSGPPSATPCVLAHGFGSGKATYYRNVDSLAGAGGGRRVLALDWLGMGRSARPRFEAVAPFPTEAARDAAVARGVDWFTKSFDAWVDACVPGRKVDIVAHSMGAYFATHYALRRPDRVDRLVLVSPLGLPFAPDAARPAGVRRRGTGPSARAARRAAAVATAGTDASAAGLRTASSELLLRLWRWSCTPQTMLRTVGVLGDAAAFAAALRSVRERYARVAVSEEDVLDLAKYLYSINVLDASSEFALTSLFAPADRDDALRGIYARRPLAAEDLESLSCDTTVLFGDRDWMFNPAVPDVLGRFGPDGADLVIVPDSGHQIALENADAFNRVVGDVLARGR